MVGVNGWIGNWPPGIGDPTPIGWVTVVLYVVAAWLCFRVIRLEYGQKWLWGGLVGEYMAMYIDHV